MDKKLVKIKSIPKGKSSVISPFPNFDILSTPGQIETNTTGTNSQDINDSVKPVDRDKATIEAEKGEVLLNPGLEGIFKVKGKKHSQGGTPLPAKPGSFIISDDKALAVTKDECDMFDFKKASSKKKSEYTPAKVALREVNPKEYNTLMSILNDPNKDDIAKKTAAIMLAKYQEKLGQVAMLQELKKGLPDGLPEFAAPPPMPETSEENYLTMFKTGGKVKKYQDGAMVPLEGGNIAASLKKPKRTKPVGVFDAEWLQLLRDNPNAILSGEATSNIMQQILSPQHKRANGKYGDSDWNLQDFRNRHGWFFEQYPDAKMDNPTDVKTFQTAYNRKSNDMYGRNYFGSNGFRAIDGKFGEYTYNAPSLKDRTPRVTNIPNDRTQFTPNLVQNVPDRPNITDREPAPGEIPWEGYNLGMTPVEMLSVAAPGLTAMSMKTFYDPLWQKYTPNERLDRVDNSRQINDIRSQSALAQREMFTNMPGNQAYSASGQVRANELDNINRSDVQTDQQNIPIANMEAGLNRQQKIADRDWNMDEIASTYDKNVMSQQRRQEMVANGINQSLNNAFDVEQNIQMMEQQATAAALPYLTHMKDENGKTVTITGEDGRKYAVQGVPFGFSKNRMPMFQPGFGSLDTFGVQMQQQGNKQTLSSILAKMDEAIKNQDWDGLNALSRSAYAIGRDNTQGAYQNPYLNFIPKARTPNGY